MQENLTQKRLIYISISVVALFLGILLAVQFRVTNDPQVIPRERAEKLVGELRQLTADNSNLEKEIQDLNTKLRQVNTGQQEAVEAVQSELDKARMAAGMVTVKGPGIEVILDNPEGSDRAMPEPSLIRDEDLLRIVNELRAAGAEALSLNGHRILAISEIRFAGSFINVNTNRVVPPYQVLAIGDQKELEEALVIPGGIFEYLGRDLGIEIKIKTHDSLTIPAYSQKMSRRYAEET